MSRISSARRDLDGHWPCNELWDFHLSRMSNDLALVLHQTGKAHAEACCLLYKASFGQGQTEGADDLCKYAFNGPYSLSIQYLLGLGLELMLKSAIAAWDSEVDAEFLRNNVGHDLVVALDQAEQRGFKSQAAHLRELVEILRDPYRKHWFRYERPPQMKLPGDFDQVVATLTALESELRAKQKPDAPAGD